MYRHGWFCWKLDVMSTKVFFHPFCSLRVKIRFSSSRVVLWISGCHLQLVPDHSSAEPMPVQAIRNSRAPWARGIWKTSNHPFFLDFISLFQCCTLGHQIMWKGVSHFTGCHIKTLHDFFSRCISSLEKQLQTFRGHVSQHSWFSKPLVFALQSSLSQTKNLGLFILFLFS